MIFQATIIHQERLKPLGMGISVKKQNVQAVIIILFAALLLLLCLTERSKTQPAEMVELQDAMRSLKRVDNLEYSYAYKTTMDGESQVQSVDVWADQLEGSWVAEYYSTDEDGTLCILKQFCDGKEVYHYVEWSGEWVKQSGVSKDVPKLDVLTSLDYDSTAIIKIDSASESGFRRINCELEPAAYTADYPEDIMSMLQIADFTMSYSIDAADVLCGEYSSLVLMQADDILTIEVQITVKRYNQEGILNKIQQCQNELW
jgi:hypothetical protein